MIRDGQHRFLLAPLEAVDGALIFEARIQSATTHVYIAAYADDDTVFEPVNKSTSTTGSDVDVDVSGDGVPADTPVGWFLSISGSITAYYSYDIRKKGNSNSLYYDHDERNNNAQHLAFSGLDANRKAVQKIENLANDLWLIGWESLGQSFDTGTPLTIGPTGSWVIIDASGIVSTQAVLVALRAQNTGASPYGVNIRIHGAASPDDFSSSIDLAAGCQMDLIACLDDDKKFDIWIEHDDVKVYLIGDVQNAPAGGSPIAVIMHHYQQQRR